ncbi:MAG: glutathione-dependent formaldehyde dehydrogenase [Cyanobacteria bacterium SZAS-4]|nr:glutathione-dependent formaldehyde dehydrogenase [Cyanobacteria bacterium SZAS-4]
MKALTWHGTRDVRYEDVEDPKIVNASDIIIKITATAICGSDLHIYDGYTPMMEKGDILGHEFAGQVIETGSEVSKLKKGDRVVVPFVIACGACLFCKQEKYSLCETTNPDHEKLEKLTAHPTAGLFGYSHLYGGYPGGQAQYVRVPHADVGALVLPDAVSEQHALFLSDIFPTGYMAAENCDIVEGDTVAVWGCGPVGQFAIKSAFMFGAQSVIAIDRFAERLEMAKASGAIPVNYEEEDVDARLRELTDGRGPHSCIDAVGLEAHGHGADAVYDKVMQAIRMEMDRTHALRQMIRVCRNGGTISIPGVYLGFVDKFPLGIAFSKGLNFRMGQTHVQRYMKPLLEKIIANEIDPEFVVSHRVGLSEAPNAYKMFAEKQDKCTKFVLDPSS